MNVEKTLTAFDHWEQYGNWVKGYLSVNLYPSYYSFSSNINVEVRVYVDSQGWVVAYLPRGTAPANMMMWTGVTQGASNLQSISTTALEEALKKVLLAAGVDFAPLQGQVRYYDFEYPAATSIGIWAKVATVAPGQWVNFKLSMVYGATIYSESVFPLASYNGVWYFSSSASRLRQWASTGGDVPHAAKMGIPEMTPGLDYSYSVGASPFVSGNQTLGIAVVVIYNLP